MTTIPKNGIHMANPLLPKLKRDGFRSTCAGLLDWFFDLVSFWINETNLDATEKIVISFQAILVLAVVVVQHAIVTPPAEYQKYVLVLPLFAWSVLLVISVLWQMLGVLTLGECRRRNAAAYCFFVDLLLLGALFMKAPGMGCLCAMLVVWQGVLAARLHFICKKDKSPCDA